MWQCPHTPTHPTPTHPGPLARDLAAIVPDARVGVADKEDFDQTFIAPLAAPGVPARLYFLFQQPIVLRPEEAGDKARCEEVYSQVGRRLGGGGGEGSCVDGDICTGTCPWDTLIESAAQTACKR
jgi:hypothetical protein